MCCYSADLLFGETGFSLLLQRFSLTARPLLHFSFVLQTTFQQHQAFDSAIKFLYSLRLVHRNSTAFWHTIPGVDSGDYRLCTAEQCLQLQTGKQSIHKTRSATNPKQVHKLRSGLHAAGSRLVSTTTPVNVCRSDQSSELCDVTTTATWGGDVKHGQKGIGKVAR